MIGPKHGSLLFLAATVATLAACATPRGALTSSADVIAHDADVLAGDARADSFEYGTADYSGDGRSLAGQAQALARTAKNRGADRQDVANAFDRLARSYDALREDADRSGNPNAIAELNPITQDLIGLEWDLGEPLALNRYAERDGRNRS